MHVPVLKREVWSFPEAIVTLRRDEFLWSIQSFRGACLLLIPLRRRGDAPIRAPRASDGLLRTFILLPCDKVLFPLFVASQRHVGRHIVHIGTSNANRRLSDIQLFTLIHCD